MLCLALPLSAQAQVPQQTLQSISRPDKVESHIGTLKFKDGRHEHYATLNLDRGDWPQSL